MSRRDALPILLLALLLLIRGSDALGARASPDGATGLERKHKPHHLLLFMGGAKSLAALVLIKIKIVLVVAAIVAVVVFTIKYLLGAAELPGLLYKGHPEPPQYPPHPPSYLPVVHEPLYGYAAPPTPAPWDLDYHHHHHHHEEYKNEWSKVGNGARSSIPDVKTLTKKKFNYRRKKRRI